MLLLTTIKVNREQKKRKDKQNTEGKFGLKTNSNRVKYVVWTDNFVNEVIHPDGFHLVIGLLRVAANSTE